MSQHVSTLLQALVASVTQIKHVEDLEVAVEVPRGGNGSEFRSRGGEDTFKEVTFDQRPD